MIPCAVIALLLTVFFVKRVSLKRDDDAVKKAEAKAWVDSKKEKKRHGKETGHDVPSRRESETSDLTAPRSVVAEAGDDREAGELEKVEHALEEAGRGVGEAGGLKPSVKEGLDQGAVSVRKD